MNFKRNNTAALLYLLTFLLIVITLSCTNFSSQFERIENNRIRLIDFIYEPPEAAPGDTVLLKALFAGKEVSAEDISWKFSTKVDMNTYGVDTAWDEKPLDYTIVPYSFSDSTSCIVLRFVVPPDCISESPMITDNWQSNLPKEILENIPETWSSLSKKELLTMLDSLSTVIMQGDSSEKAAYAVLVQSLLPDGSLPLLMQLLTVKMRIYADVKNSHRIRSDYTVNYNSRFSSLPGIPHFDNHNPVIDSIGLYCVKGSSVLKLDRDNDSTTYTTLWKPGDSTVVINTKKGHTYFLEAFVSNRDSVITLTALEQNGSTMLEEVTADWMFQLDDHETENANNNDLMNISPINDLTAVLYLPRKKEISHFTIWVQVTDSKINVMNRSQGSSVVEVNGRFTYP